MSDQIVHRIFDWPTFKVQDGQSPQTWPSNQYGRRHLHVPPCATATTLHYGVRVAPSPLSPLGDCIAIIFARTALAPSPLGRSFLPQTSSCDVAKGGTRAAHHKPPAIAAAASRHRAHRGFPTAPTRWQGFSIAHGSEKGPWPGHQRGRASASPPCRSLFPLGSV